MKKKRLKYLFFGFFFIGILIANLFGKEKLAQFGIFNNYYLQQFEYAQIDETDLFLYIVRERLPVLGFLVLFGMTEFWYPMHLLFVAWNGGAIGFLFVSALSNLGVKGILLVVLSLIPQYIFYVLMYLLLFELQGMQHGEAGNGFSGGKIKHKGKYLVGFGIILLFAVFGILTETYINPFLMKNIIKLF